MNQEDESFNYGMEHVVHEDGNEELRLNVEDDSPLKYMLVDYVGEKLQPENGDVTLEMVIETVAQEFPAFLLAVAEENFVRGYEQAFSDIEEVGEGIDEELGQIRENTNQINE